MLTLTNLIANQDSLPTSGAFLDVFEPATGNPYAKVPDSSAEDVARAVEAAEQAFPAWSATPAAQRGKLLNRWAELVESRLEEFAQAESKNAGKTITATRTIDAPRSAANLRFFASAIQHTSSEMYDFDAGGATGAVVGGVRAINYVLRRARGVAGCISPWNYPLHLFTWKIAPALASGCTVVAKPSEVTPVTAWMLGHLAREAGFPAGVFNIVHGGATAGSAIVDHPRTTTITFTGSTPVGKRIAETCGRSLKRVSLELGGKNPFLIFDDADLDSAMDTASRAAFGNQGQICLCGSRLLVHERVYDRIVEGLVQRAKALKPGDPSDDTTNFGAVSSKAHLAKITSMVEEARAAGAVIRVGGSSPSDMPARCKDGYFYLPTVIEKMPPFCRPASEEIFGPVVSIQPFRDESEAIALANNTPYGLSASLFTRDVARAHRAAASIQAGVVWVNCWNVRDLRTPFGGMKQSGVGREGGTDALRFFTEPKNICIGVPS